MAPSGTGAWHAEGPGAVPAHPGRIEAAGGQCRISAAGGGGSDSNTDTTPPFTRPDSGCGRGWRGRRADLRTGAEIAAGAADAVIGLRAPPGREPHERETVTRLRVAGGHDVAMATHFVRVECRARALRARGRARRAA